MFTHSMLHGGESPMDTSEQHLSEQRSVYARNIIRFLDVEVKDIMTNRNDIVAIEASTPFRDVFNITSQSGFSRIPVYQKDYDHIIGVLYAKHLLQYYDKEDDFEWNSILSTPLFVPEYKDAHRLLKDFQTAKRHIALVIDEYGGLVGLVTLEDILEEIVGEIIDEFDTAELPLYTKIDDNRYVFEAKISVNDFCKIIGLADDEIFEEVRGEADSLGGLLIEIQGEIPSSGTMIEYERFQFVIERSDDRHIEKVRVLIKENTLHEK